MRCPRCGNENPDGNRFCGMCGATLLSAPAIAETATQRAASAGTAVPSSAPVSVVPPLDPPRPSARESSESNESRETDDAPIISGPSFLGLSDPNPRKRATLRADGHSSRNVDYLLEDEPRESGGAGKFILLVAILALAAGFGYMTWKNHGVGWVSALLSKPPAPAQQAPSDGVNGAPSVAPATPAAESQNPPPGQSTPPATATQPPPSDNTKPASTASSSPASTSPATHPSEDSKPATAANPPADGDEDGEASAEDKPPATPVAKPAKPKAAVETPRAKPHAAIEPAKPVDTVSEAQKYLYGRGGAAQDCDRGLKLLKPAANAANPKAMIEMGGLYSAGLCTPRDLPTAYRWFAIALRKDPENNSVQQDLQKLWGEMTQPERQLAIKLTQ